MFLSTTGIGEWSALNWIKGPDCNNEQEFDENDRKRHSEYYTRAEEQKVFLREQFLAVLPNLPSHYCRKSTNKLYLEQSIKSMNDLHRIYVEKCNAENQKPLGIKLLRDEFNKMSLALFQPKKDQCDICVAHNTGNLSDEEWEFHLSKKEAARKEKALDKERASENDRLLVTTMDLQAVLLSPCLKASALYYKTKLAVHNFTVYNLKSHDVVCYVWHEGEGGLCASEFASCIFDFIKEKVDNYDEFILYSDGCTYQNRNVVMSNTLLSLSQYYQKTITQKFLERGHTQMEVDSAHSVVERKLKNVDIYVPGDYVNIIRNARKPPYVVRYLDHDFFMDFSKIGPYKSIRPGAKVGDPTVMDLRCIRYMPNGEVSYKINYEDEWKTLLKPRAVQREEPIVLYQTKLKIKETKYQHLQQLKTVMPRDYHTFYDNLSH